MAARKTRSSSAAKGKGPRPQSPPKQVPIPYEHAGDYRQFCSTGSLVRAERNSIVITFYIDEMSPTQQVARLVSVQEQGGS